MWFACTLARVAGDELVVDVLLRDVLHADELIGIYIRRSCFEFSDTCLESLVLVLKLDVLGLGNCEESLKLIGAVFFLTGEVKQPLLFISRGFVMRR